MIRPIGVLTTVILGLTGCAWHDIYTLSPAVKESAHQYSDVMDDFADEALLANVLRARDYAPLNFNDLSAITGSMSLSGTASLTLPFGPFIGPRYPAATSLGMFRDTGMPSFTGSSSPVITLGTLNTQGFMMTMIQPVSTTYILSKWDSYPHELLLLLFVKSIRFPSDPTDIKPSIYRNDPDTPSDFHDFQALIEKMLANTVTPTSSTGRIGNVDMKSLMILDPLGDPVPMGQTLAATMPIPSQTLSVPAPAAPRMDGAGANESPVGTYYAKVTYVTNLGETLPSSEASFKVDGTATKGVEILLTQPSPPQGAPSAMGYNVYVSLNSAGQETRQNPLPLPLGSPWLVPKGGLLTGPFPPDVNPSGA